MGSDWLELLDHVLCPTRPALARCLAERDRQQVLCRGVDEQQALLLADCRRRIELLRSAVFEAGDGVVTASMTALEREWRRLARRGAEAGLLELWAVMAPASWLDRKRFRDSTPARWRDAAVALAADAENVERAEQAIDSLATRLAPLGKRIARRVRWRMAEQDPEPVGALLAGAAQAARDACPEPQRAALLERAQRAEQRVRAEALERLPERPLLARDIAFAALVDCLWRSVRLPDDANPVSPLRTLWRTGYVLSEADASWVTLELPPLLLSSVAKVE